MPRKKLTAAQRRKIRNQELKAAARRRAAKKRKKIPDVGTGVRLGRPKRKLLPHEKAIQPFRKRKSRKIRFK